MLKRFARSILILMLVLPLGALANRNALHAHGLADQSASCPVHGSSGAYFTGNTKTMDGVLMHEYKCPAGGGHTFWVAQRQPDKNRSGVQCPVHGNSGAYFTGKTKTIDGVLLYEYNCPGGGGHTFWRRPPTA